MAENTLKLTTDQEQALDLDKNMLILAGAGSGKTRVLTERYFRIVEDSINKGQAVQPGNILVVTFTEKAAGEMRDRIQFRIENQQGPGWDEFSDRFLDNQISTFHSFCALVLQAFPLEAGIDPEFRVIDGFDQRQLLMETVEKEINQLSRVGDEGLRELLFLWNRRQLENNLVELVEKRYEVKDTLEDYKNLGEQDFLDRWFGNSPLPVLSRSRVLELLEPLIAFAGLDVSPEDPGISFIRLLAKYYHVLQGKGAGGDKWEEAIDFRELVEHFLTSAGKYGKMTGYQQVGVKKNWEGYEKEHAEVKKILQGIKDCLEEVLPAEKIDCLPNYLDRELARLLPTLARITGQCVERYQKEKKQRNYLDFNDLEGITHRLIEHKEETIQKLGDRYGYIMVDEFQDTNSRQWEIIETIWKKGSKSNLFLVGDIKQAIYSFRGGDVTIFNRGKKEIERTGENIVFNQNFRSCGNLIGFFNSFFHKLLQDAEEEYEAPFQRLEPGAEKENLPGEAGAVIVEKKGNRLERIFSEAQKVAEKVEETIRLLPEEVSAPRVAILLRSLTHVHHYEQALRRAEIGFTTVRGRGFFNQQEILDLCNLLFFLSDPRRDIELIGLLRSPFFGVSDAEIYGLARIDGETFWEKLKKARGERWEAIKRDLNSWFYLKDRLPLGELLQRVLEEGRFFLYLNLGERSQQKTRNVEKFMEFARQFARGGKSLGEFNHFLEEQIKKPGEEGEALTEVDTDVAIMSIHQAKGLQFPGVILADLGGRFNLGQSDPIRRGKIEEKEELCFVVIDPRTGLKGTPAVRKKIGRRLQSEQLAEEKRLLYVAATRAERYLYLVGSRDISGDYNKRGTASSYLDWLEAAYGGPSLPIAEEERVLKVEIVSEDGKEFPEASLKKNGSELPIESIREEELGNWKPAPLPRYYEIEISPTDLGLFWECPLKYFYQQELLLAKDMLPREKTIRDFTTPDLDPLKVGQLFHGMMEAGKYRTEGPDWEEQLKKVEILPGKKDLYGNEVKRHLENLQASGWLKRIKNAEEDIKEKKFRIRWKSEKGLVIYLKGVIDRLFRENGNWKLLDFKTTALNGKTPEEVTAQNNYHLQLTCYEEALKCLAPPLEVDQAWIIYTATGQGQEIKQKKSYSKKIERAALRISRRQFPPRVGRQCRFCQYFSICPAQKCREVKDNAIEKDPLG